MRKRSNKLKSAAEFFRQADGKQVEKQVTGIRTVEDWPKMVEQAHKWAEENGYTQVPAGTVLQENQYSVSEDQYEIFRSAGQVLFVRKPAAYGTETGIMTVRSADYIFTSDQTGKHLYGDKKGAKIVDGKLVKDMGNGGTVTYRILN